jgi:chemotaxis signal transduction protein
MSAHPARAWMSTRIIVVQQPAAIGQAMRFVGLLAEQVTETAQYQNEDFEDAGVKGGSAAYLGGIAISTAGMVQRVSVETLFSVDALDQLLGKEEAS